MTSHGTPHMRLGHVDHAPAHAAAPKRGRTYPPACRTMPAVSPHLSIGIIDVLPSNSDSFARLAPQAREQLLPPRAPAPLRPAPRPT